MAEPAATVSLVSALVSEVRRRLAEAGDPEKAPAMRAYMKSALPFHGVTAVPLRKLCRELVDAEPLPDEAAWRAAVLELWDGATHREERYAVLALCSHRRYRAYQHPGTLDLYRHLVVTGAWWDLVDDLASHKVGPILRADFEEVSGLIRAWAVDDDLWVRRTAILCQLGSKAETDVFLLRWCLVQNLEDSMHGREFFIRKAVGWALREYARTDPAWVRVFVAEHGSRMSGLSRREATKHLG